MQNILENFREIDFTKFFVKSISRKNLKNPVPRLFEILKPDILTRSSWFELFNFLFWSVVHLFQVNISLIIAKKNDFEIMTNSIRDAANIPGSTFSIGRITNGAVII